MTKLRGLSLFSGIGGLDLAFEWASGEVKAMCEIEPYCRKVLHKHWPNITIFEDIKELKGTDVGAVDIIYGGFPCQPFSVAGKQKGKEDSRYLWPEFSRLVGEIKPLWVVAENVSGILRIAAEDVCRDLESKGYAVGIWDFEAAAVGAKHRRERVFFVAHAGRSLQSGSFKKVTIQNENREKTSYQFERPSRQWELEPGLDRVAYGVSYRVDRLRALGNAVVPQQAYPIFRAIMETMK